jgi:hypothetical protein
MLLPIPVLPKSVPSIVVGVLSPSEIEIPFDWMSISEFAVIRVPESEKL